MTAKTGDPTRATAFAAIVAAAAAVCRADGGRGGLTTSKATASARRSTAVNGPPPPAENLRRHGRQRADVQRAVRAAVRRALTLGVAVNLPNPAEIGKFIACS